MRDKDWLGSTEVEEQGPTSAMRWGRGRRRREKVKREEGSRSDRVEEKRNLILLYHDHPCSFDFFDSRAVGASSANVSGGTESDARALRHLYTGDRPTLTEPDHVPLSALSPHPRHAWPPSRP